MRILMIVFFILCAELVAAQLRAFPEAEGFGAFASGGRGGTVIKVTNLNATGAGSLQAALNQSGPRIIVFDVAGIITADIRIPHGDVTVAGQTAPGAGVTIVGHLYTPYDSQPDVSNIIIRHIRVRPPNPNKEWPADQHDAIQFSTAHTIILDHIDASHGADETIDFFAGASFITIQRSHISFPIYEPLSGWDHNKGLINHRPCLDSFSDFFPCTAESRTGGYISVLNNVFTHARNRTPALSVGPAEVINNITYNGREGFVHHNIADGQFNIVGNHHIEGPNISLAPLWFDPENALPPIPTEYWVDDILVEDPGSFNGVVNNPWENQAFNNAYSFYCCGINQNQFNQSDGPFNYNIYQQYWPPLIKSSQVLIAELLPTIGAHPHDVVSRQSLFELNDRSGQWRNYRPADLMAGLTVRNAATDSDNDGMPDDWEQNNGLNPATADNNTIMPSGYTAIEVYINEIASELNLDLLFVDGFEVDVE